MGVWSYYFLAKILLYFRGHIPFDVALNGLFAAWLLIPPPEPRRRSRWGRLGRGAVTAVAGGLLTWRDSWLPSLPETFRFVRGTQAPTAEFLAQLTWDAVVTWEVVIIAGALGIAAATARLVRLPVVVITLLAVVAVHSYGGDIGAEADRRLAEFYTRQASQTRSVEAPSGEPYDIALIHVCSLSWDDLDAAGLTDDPFLAGFDLLLTRFNSVTSHSNPSALRLLRSTCGQVPHDALYRPAPIECYVADAMSAGGFRVYTALNYDQRNGGFGADIRAFGHAPVPENIAGLPVRLLDFQGDPVYKDGAVLSEWWRRRTSGADSRAMLYYNTITLHDGGRGVDDPEWWTRGRVDRYREATEILFRDLEEFMDRVEADGRRMVVVVVAEHGMALRGSGVQPAGLREVPLPAITRVPVGIKLLGPGWFRGPRPSQQVIDRPTSYIAIPSWLGALSSHAGGGLDEWELHRLAEAIPAVPFVAENHDVVVVRDDDGYAARHRSPGMRWAPLPIAPGNGIS